MRRRTGLPWEDLPRELGCGSGMTCWRRLRDWQQYPALASWVKDGWVEIGHTDYTRSFVRAFDEGGMV
jgi:transposase